MKLKVLNLFFLFTSLTIYSQKSISRILWNKIENKPVEYATVKDKNNYTISNEEGIFEIQETIGNIEIQSLVYKKLNVDFNFLKNNDTIYMKPLTYELDEIVLNKDGLYKTMLKTVPTDYALQPHKEKFFLRAVIRKNSELYKIVDFSGLVEKKSLFGTKIKPMPKKNYKVQINNIRKVGIENRDIDFAMLSFKEFFTYSIRVSAEIEKFNVKYEVADKENSTKIIFNPKEKEETFFKGFYILSDDNTFKEANITFINNSLYFDKIRKTKFRTTFMNWKSNFERNKRTNKLQLNKVKIKSTTEVITAEVKDIYEVTYIYYAEPISEKIEIKNSIKLKKDMFDLKGKYDKAYWENNEFLSLTEEMQKFINKVNSSKRNSEFRTKINIE